MTQEELAEKAGVATSTVNRIENATAGYSPESLALLAGALDCTVGDLFSVNARDEIEIALWELIRSLDREQRKQLTSIGQALRGGWRVASR